VRVQGEQREWLKEKSKPIHITKFSERVRSDEKVDGGFFLSTPNISEFTTTDLLGWDS
jgi:hypothetical protein